MLKNQSIFDVKIFVSSFNLKSLGMLAFALFLFSFSNASLAEKKGFWERSSVGKFLSNLKRNNSGISPLKNRGSETINYTIDPSNKRRAIYTVKGKTFTLDFPKGLCTGITKDFLAPSLKERLTQNAKKERIIAPLKLERCPGKEGKNNLVGLMFSYDAPPQKLKVKLNTALKDKKSRRQLIDELRNSYDKVFQAEIDKYLKNPLLLDKWKKLGEQTGVKVRFSIKPIKKISSHENGFYSGYKQILQKGTREHIIYVVVSFFLMDGEIYNLTVIGELGKPLPVVLKESQTITQSLLSQIRLAPQQGKTLLAKSKATQPEQITKQEKKQKSGLSSADTSKKKYVDSSKQVASKKKESKNPIQARPTNSRKVTFNVGESRFLYTLPTGMCKKTQKKQPTLSSQIQLLFLVSCSPFLDRHHRDGLAKTGSPIPPFYVQIFYFTNKNKKPMRVDDKKANNLFRHIVTTWQKNEHQFASDQNLQRQEKFIEIADPKFKNQISDFKYINSTISAQTDKTVHFAIQRQFKFKSAEYYAQYTLVSFIYSGGHIYRIYSFYPATRTFSPIPFFKFQRQIIRPLL